MTEGAISIPSSKDSDESITDQTYRALVQMILSKELMAGVPLQERKLAETLGVSRTPLREAMNRLAGNGILIRLPNRGLTVRSFDIKDYIEVLHVRRLLEGETASLAALRIRRADIQAVREQILELMSKPNPSTNDHWGVDDALHGLVATAADSQLLSSLIQELRSRTRIFDMKQLPERFLPGCQEHLAILEALETGNPDTARRAMITHIENVKASILQGLSRL